MNEYMMELLDEMVNPGELALEGTVEDEIAAEDDVLFGCAEVDDDVIQFIDDGGLGYEDPIDFNEPSVEDVVNDDMLD